MKVQMTNNKIGRKKEEIRVKKYLKVRIHKIWQTNGYFCQKSRKNLPCGGKISVMDVTIPHPISYRHYLRTLLSTALWEGRKLMSETKI